MQFLGFDTMLTGGALTGGRVDWNSLHCLCNFSVNPKRFQDENFKINVKSESGCHLTVVMATSILAAHIRGTTYNLITLYVAYKTKCCALWPSNSTPKKVPKKTFTRKQACMVRRNLNVGYWVTENDAMGEPNTTGSGGRSQLQLPRRQVPCSCCDFCFHFCL